MKEFTWNEETIDYFAGLYDLNGWSHVAQRVLSFVTHECDLEDGDRKSTRLNSSHQIISYAVFCLKKKTKKRNL